VSDDETDRPELDAVRRLLADARHTDPIPADVGDRMDAVLAGLSQERPDAVAEVVPLDARRRRRASGLLVAAAVIVVGGVVAAQQLPHGSSQQVAGATEDRNAQGLASSAAPGTTVPQSQTTSPQTPDSVSRLKTRAGRLVVRPRHFQDDALTGLRVLDGKVASTNYSVKLMAVSPHCVRTPAGSQVVRATYQRAPAALVYHPAAGTTQIVDLYVCGSSRPVRSVTLPTP
jgi:hypothetical protein